ncbi:MAG: cell division protein FtsA [Tannerellaceae bacterium]|jgi:cell division protein FtsA|nr:cell division protein FtsA [Tannerellaceae bacterium]
MISTNYIVAIDLGTSYIKGIIGVRSHAGIFTVIACEAESSANCIRRGVVYNVENTANRITTLLRKLANKAPGVQIKKVYVGVGGQSIRSIDHVVVNSLGADSEVRKETIDALYKECQAFKPDGLEALSIVSPTFYLDGNQENNPVGIPCSRIEAHYKLIVCRPSLKRHVMNSIAERAKIEIQGIFISPLALADVVLSEDEKDLGCALLDFGAGIASLTIFKSKRLIRLCTIPLGSHLITRDLTSLHIVESEAERLKKTYGDATADRENDSSVQVNSINGAGIRQIKLSEINEVVEARLQEILENVQARLVESGIVGKLNAGMIITGGGASLKNFDEAVRERFGTTVRYAAVNKTFFEKTSAPIEPEFGVVAGLLLKGTMNCSYTPPVSSPVNRVDAKVHAVVDVEKQKEKEKQNELEKERERERLRIREQVRRDVESEIKQPGGRGKKSRRFFDKMAGFANKLFDDKDYEDIKKKEDDAWENETEKREINNSDKQEE